MTDNEVAAKLYGETSPPPPTPDAGSGAAAPTAPAATAPASPAPASDTAPRPDHAETPDAADALFGDPAVVARSYEPTLSDSLDDLTALAPELAEKRGELLANAAEVFADAALPPERAASLHSLYVSSLRTPPDEATVQKWANESTAWLQEQFPQGYAVQLDRARRFVHARPELKEALDRGLGSHPQIVKALIENAAQLRLTPRKKK